MNAVHVNQPVRSTPALSSLELVFTAPDRRPDFPSVDVRVDGADPFAGVVTDWHGFGTEEILGSDSPLLPRDPLGHRVAVHRCSCGIEGCGVVAPVVVASPDGRVVSWVDFRDYVGVFVGPRWPGGGSDGRPWRLPDLHFGRAQYEAEVARASADLSWATPRRRTARLVWEHLAPMQLTLTDGRPLRWVSPAWTDDGLTLLFERRDGEGGQQMLRLTSRVDDPEAAAADMVTRLTSESPQDWVAEFGWVPPYDRR